MGTSKKGEGNGGLIVFLTILGLVIAAGGVWIAHRDARPPDTQPDPTKEDKAVVPPNPAPGPAPDTKPKIQARFETGGFQDEQAKPGTPNLGGTWNVACGRPDITVAQSDKSVAVAHELSFTWDASVICMGMTTENPSGRIEFSKDGEVLRRDDLPASWGKGFATFTQPGFYSGKLTYQTTCNNNGRLKACAMTGFVTVNVTQ
jgi:hypothetical protein